MKYPLFTFLDGMETLPLELAKRLKNDLKLSAKGQALHFYPEHLLLNFRMGLA